MPSERMPWACERCSMAAWTPAGTSSVPRTKPMACASSGVDAVHESMAGRVWGAGAG